MDEITNLLNRIKEVRKIDNTNLYNIYINELKDYIFEYVNQLTDLYTEKHYKDLEIFFNQNKFIRKKINDYLESSNDLLLYYLGMINGSNKVVENIYYNNSENQQFEDFMKIIIEKKHIKQILKYLYSKSFVRHSELLEGINIKYKSQLTDLMNQLIDAKCVIKYTLGKYVRYELTQNGYKYVLENIIDKEDIIDEQPNWMSKQFDIEDKIKYDNQFYKQIYCFDDENSKTIKLEENKFNKTLSLKQIKENSNSDNTLVYFIYGKDEEHGKCKLLYSTSKSNRWKLER